MATFRNLFFCSTFARTDVTTWHDEQAGTRLAGVVLFPFGFWWGNTFCASNSLELESRLCRLGQDLNTGLLWHNCTTFRIQELSPGFCFVFHQLVPHWSPISFSPPSPGRLAPSRSEVFVGSRRVRLVQALPSFPPLRWSWPVSVDPPLFLFPCLFRVCPLRARCVGVRLLSPSSFAFPSSRPG